MRSNIVCVCFFVVLTFSFVGKAVTLRLAKQNTKNALEEKVLTPSLTKHKTLSEESTKVKGKNEALKEDITMEDKTVNSDELPEASEETESRDEEPIKFDKTILSDDNINEKYLFGDDDEKKPEQSLISISQELDSIAHDPEFNSAVDALSDHIHGVLKNNRDIKFSDKDVEEILTKGAFGSFMQTKSNQKFFNKVKELAKKGMQKFKKLAKKGMQKLKNIASFLRVEVKEFIVKHIKPVALSLLRQFGKENLAKFLNATDQMIQKFKEPMKQFRPDIFRLIFVLLEKLKIDYKSAKGIKNYLKFAKYNPNLNPKSSDDESTNNEEVSKLRDDESTEDEELEEHDDESTEEEKLEEHDDESTEDEGNYSADEDESTNEDFSKAYDNKPKKKAHDDESTENEGIDLDNEYESTNDEES